MGSSKQWRACERGCADVSLWDLFVLHPSTSASTSRIISTYVVLTYRVVLLSARVLIITYQSKKRKQSQATTSPNSPHPTPRKMSASVPVAAAPPTHPSTQEAHTDESPVPQPPKRAHTESHHRDDSPMPQPPKRAYTRPDITTEPSHHHSRHHRHHKRRWSLANLRFNAAANAGRVKTKSDRDEGEEHEMPVRVERRVDVEESSAPEAKGKGVVAGSGGVGHGVAAGSTAEATAISPLGDVRGPATSHGLATGGAVIGPLGDVVSSSATELPPPALDPLGDHMKQPADSVDPFTGHPHTPTTRDFANPAGPSQTDKPIGWQAGTYDHAPNAPRRDSVLSQTDKPTGWQPGAYDPATNTPRRASKTARARASISHFLINTLPSVLLEAPSDRKARRQSLEPGKEAAYPYVKPASGDAAALDNQRRESRRRSVEASKQDPKHVRRYSGVDLDEHGQESEVFDTTTGESVGVARRDGRGGDFVFM